MAEETCVLCNAKLESKEALQNHFRKHANKEIDSKGRPIANIVSVPEVKPVKPLKKIGPRSPLSLLKPCATSEKTGDREPTKCDLCEVLFESVAKAISHRWRAHPNQPAKFYCSHCGKQFPLKTIRDKHVSNLHINMVPETVVRCEDCGEEFFNQPAVEYHAKITHKRTESVLRPVATPPPSKKIRLNNAGEAESVYYCHLCGSEYILKFNLRKHLESRHAKEDTSFGPETEIIRCTICEAVFCNKKAYDVHNMYHQPDDMYVTSEQHRLKIVSRVDQDFDLRRVQFQMPKSVRGLAKQHAKQHAKIVWNAPFNRQTSTVEPNSVVTSKKMDDNVLDPAKSPSNGKPKRNVLKEKKTVKRKRSNSSCDNSIPVDEKKGIEDTSPPKSPSKRKLNPRILKASKTLKGKSQSSPDVQNQIRSVSTRGMGKTNNQSSPGKDQKSPKQNTTSSLKEATNMENNKRVLRSRVSKN